MQLLYNLTKTPPKRRLDLQNKVSLCKRDSLLITMISELTC